MSEEPDNLVLRYLRRIDEKLDRRQEDVRELKNRTGILEQQYASISNRVDRIEQRLERIERRLGQLPTRPTRPARPPRGHPALDHRAAEAEGLPEGVGRQMLDLLKGCT